MVIQSWLNERTEKSIASFSIEKVADGTNLTEMVLTGRKDNCNLFVNSEVKIHDRRRKGKVQFTNVDFFR